MINKRVQNKLQNDIDKMNYQVLFDNYFILETGKYRFNGKFKKIINPIIIFSPIDNHYKNSIIKSYITTPFKKIIRKILNEIQTM